MAITPYSHNGEQYVRITEDGYDFAILSYQSEPMPWDDAVKFGIPTKEQYEVIAKHCDEVNAVIKQIGGKRLWYEWTCTNDSYIVAEKYIANHSAYAYICNGNVLVSKFKWASFAVRKVINF